MKHLTALTLALAASSAWAITPAPVAAPAPAPVAAPVATPSESHSAAHSTSSAAAASGSSSTATGAGGSGIAYGGIAGGGSGGSNSTSTRAVGLGFPAINFGSASTSECLVGGPSGKAIGWNFAASTAPAMVEAPVCSLRALAREAASQCQWRTAAVLRGEAFRALTGNEPPAIPEALQDVSPTECIHGAPAPVIVPPAAPAPQIAPVTVMVSTEVEQVAPVPAPRRPAKSKPAPVRCETRVIEVCEPVQEAKR